MMAVRNTNLWIGPVADFARHHERKHPRHVSLICKREKIVQHVDMLLERERDAGGRLGQSQLNAALLLRHHLNPSLHLANTVQIIADCATVLRAETAL